MKVYKFEELKPEVQEKVINKFRESEDFDFLSEYLNELLVEKLKEHCIEYNDELKLYYSLSNSQGDGCCFDGGFHYMEKNVDRPIYVSIKRMGHYYHSHSVAMAFYDVDDNTIYDTVVTMTFEALFESICDELEKAGYEYMEHATSDETIKDNIESNDYEFFEDGEIA
jgi:hypothetical protein